MRGRHAAIHEIIAQIRAAGEFVERGKWCGALFAFREYSGFVFMHTLTFSAVKGAYQ